jgi:predicted Zn-dependent protease
MMANLEESDPDLIGLPIERFVEYRGTYWVPIETTKLGTSFGEAWQSGTAEINAGKDKKEIQFVSVSESAEKYAPVTLVEADPNQPGFPEDKVSAVFPKTLAALENERFDRRVKILKEKIAADPEDHMLQVQLGMVYVEGRKAADATQLFTSLLQDPSVDVQAAAQNNLGNLAYLKGDYATASKAYATASILSPDDGGIVINRARTAWKMGESASSQAFLRDAAKLMPDWKEYTTDIPAEYLPK